METSANLLESLRTSLDGASSRYIDELNWPLIRRCLRTVADNRLGVFYRLRQNRPTSLSCKVDPIV